MNDIMNEQEEKMKYKIENFFNEEKEKYINSLSLEKKISIYESNSITFIDGVSIIFLFTFPIYLVHLVIPDFKNDFQMLINIIGYFLFTIILFLGMYGIEKIFTKNNSKNIYEKKDFDEVIEKSFFKIPATKEILKKVKYTYGTEKMLSLLEENNGNITNEDIRNIISEEEKNNKYKDIVDSL